jgi:NAD(P)-dependent dehydrogenase (short-subunit alcohol dehydrogenase family)
MLPRLDGQVVAVGGGHEGVGLAVARALLFARARVVVPVVSDDAAERLYLTVDPECVPHLRTAVGAPDDPATLARVAAVARREFGGIDHLVAAWAAPGSGWLNTLDAESADAALRAHVAAPGLFVLGLLRHLNGNAADVKRVVVLVAPARDGARADAWALGRSFGEGLVGLLRGAARPGTDFHALACAALGTADDRAAELAGRATAWLLAEGAAAVVVDAATLDR